MGINVDNSTQTGVAYVRRGEAAQQIWNASFIL
jgi:hypothetical protein